MIWTNEKEMLKKIEELERENTRLKAPVSDEEIEPFGYMPTMRAKFNEIIASRATRTPPQEGQ